MAPKSTAQRSKSYRDRIKDDPEQYQRYLQKEKERYKKRKETNKLQCISQLPKHIQRYKRRRWRINQRNKRTNDKQRRNMDDYLTVNSPSVSPTEQPEQHNTVSVPTARCESPNQPTAQETPQQRGRKKVNRNRSKVYRDLCEANLKLERAKQVEMEKYKKRYERLSNKLKSQESPRSKSKQQMKSEKCDFECHDPQTMDSKATPDDRTVDEGQPIMTRTSAQSQGPSLQVEDITGGQRGRWCVVLYDGDAYPGIIQDVDSDDSVLVKIMSRIGENHFFWPQRDDIIWYRKKDVLGLVPEPQPITYMMLNASVWKQVRSLME